MSVCFYCGTILMFNSDLTIRLPTDEEVIELHISGAWQEAEKLKEKLKSARNQDKSQGIKRV